MDAVLLIKSIPIIQAMKDQDHLTAQYPLIFPRKSFEITELNVPCQKNSSLLTDSSRMSQNTEKNTQDRFLRRHQAQVYSRFNENLVEESFSKKKPNIYSEESITARHPKKITLSDRLHMSNIVYTSRQAEANENLQEISKDIILIEN